MLVSLLHPFKEISFSCQIILTKQIFPKMTIFFDIFSKKKKKKKNFGRDSELLHGLKRLRDIFHGKIEHSWLYRKTYGLKKGGT